MSSSGVGPEQDPLERYYRIEEIERIRWEEEKKSKRPPPLLHKVVKPAKGVITNPNGKSPHLRNVLLSVGKVWTVLRIMRGDINTL